MERYDDTVKHDLQAMASVCVQFKSGDRFEGPEAATY